ncbi:MAG: ABC transporter ATP-binding protein [Variibacter sp.]|nr:ABC transporter ATP-binding protein [Variibacter sp.]
MTPDADALLAADAVCVRIGARLVVEDVSFALRAGELAVLVGPNGAGKTTLLRALAGLIPATGAIRLEQRALEAYRPAERARRLAYLPQGHVFHWPLAVRAAVALGRLPHADPFARVSAADAAAVDAAIAAADLAALAERSVLTLSGGERARVALARALATGARVLLADEPTASLDPRHQLAVMDRLREVARAGGAVLAVTHDLALAARYGDRVLVMQAGRIVADAPPALALSPERLAQVFQVDAQMVDLAGTAVPFVRRPL